MRLSLLNLARAAVAVANLNAEKSTITVQVQVAVRVMTAKCAELARIPSVPHGPGHRETASPDQALAVQGGPPNTPTKPFEFVPRSDFILLLTEVGGLNKLVGLHRPILANDCTAFCKVLLILFIINQTLTNFNCLLVALLFVFQFFLLL
jgi:hypothetical protein